MDDRSIEGQVQLARAAYDELIGLGEEIEDEWSYVNDLANAWRSRLDELVASRGAESATLEQVAAVEASMDEIRRITDPHRAIDWLSTFPQVVLTAFGDKP